MAPAPTSFGRRLADLAADRGSAAAVVLIDHTGADRTLTYRELDQVADVAAANLHRAGARAGRVVVVGLRNELAHLAATLGAMRLGASVVPLRWDLPLWERRRLLAVAQPCIVVARWDEADVQPEHLLSDPTSRPVLDNPVADLPYAITTGGATGTPKLVAFPGTGLFDSARAFGIVGDRLGLRQSLRNLVAGPLYHNNPFTMTYIGLLTGHQVVLMERFSASNWLAAVERHRIEFASLVPTMMRRIIRNPVVSSADLSSLHTLFHTAGPCPPTTKRAWIELLGPDRVVEGFGSTEYVGIVLGDGHDWLAHPGTVGRPYRTELRIIDDHGQDVVPGEPGEIYMRVEGTTRPEFIYIGGLPPRTVDGGFVSVGDLGWLEDGQWLHVIDRRADLIVTGGESVYPTEVEAALLEHHDVEEAVVVGLPDEEWISRVHAVVELSPGASVTSEQLRRHCLDLLTAYKAPKSYEFVTTVPRDEMGKVRRAAIADDRVLNGPVTR
jgi:bile acid-coenzyme A ligase